MSILLNVQKASVVATSKCQSKDLQRQATFINYNSQGNYLKNIFSVHKQKTLIKKKSLRIFCCCKGTKSKSNQKLEQNVRLW